MLQQSPPKSPHRPIWNSFLPLFPAIHNFFRVVTLIYSICQKKTDFHNGICACEQEMTEQVVICYACHTLYVDYCTCARFVLLFHVFLIVQINSLQTEDGPNPAEEDFSPARGNITFAPGRSMLIYNLTVLDDQVRKS